jgi:hypothetical protein
MLKTAQQIAALVLDKLAEKDCGEKLCEPETNEKMPEENLTGGAKGKKSKKEASAIAFEVLEKVAVGEAISGAIPAGWSPERWAAQNTEGGVAPRPLNSWSEVMGQQAAARPQRPQQSFSIGRDRVRDSYRLSNPVDRYLTGQTQTKGDLVFNKSWKEPTPAPAQKAPAAQPSRNTAVDKRLSSLGFVPKQTTFNTSKPADREYLGLSDKFPQGKRVEYDSRTAPAKPAYVPAAQRPQNTIAPPRAQGVPLTLDNLPRYNNPFSRNATRPTMGFVPPQQLPKEPVGGY